MLDTIETLEKTDMLNKELCIEAIQRWKLNKSEYEKVETLFSPTAVFNFSEDDCAWLNKHNNNAQFHTYIGIHGKNLILIVVPLDKDGVEVELKSYLTSTLSELKKNITLIEQDKITTTTRTTLNQELEISKISVDSDLPTYNEPVMTERASVHDIENWKNNCLDWFYKECNEFKGLRIFNTFTVPFADLILDSSDYNEVTALFGFKDSVIYQGPIPVLIFVAVHNTSGTAEILRAPSYEDESGTNTKDYSQPCPPMCRASKDYGLLS